MNSSLQQKLTLCDHKSLGHGYAGIEKFHTLMNIPKPMTVKNYNKTVSKIIDAVNVVDVVYQRY